MGTLSKHPDELSFETHQALWLLASFCALHRIAFNPALLTQRCPPPIRPDVLAEVAGELQLNLECERQGLESAAGLALADRCSDERANSLSASATPPWSARRGMLLGRCLREYVCLDIERAS